MKKIIALLLALVMVVGLVACGTPAPVESQPSEPSQPAESQPAEPSQPAESQPAEPTMGDPVDRAEYGIPAQYTKVKVFVGTYGFGDAEIVAAFNDDETAFYLTFVCFDEEQIVEGTINNGIAMVSYDKSGFMSADAQLICDDAFASSELWCPLTGEAAAPMADPVDRNEYGIPETYTKVKVFVGTYGFGDAEIVAAFNDDETAFYLTFVCFDEEQIVEGTIANGIAMVSYDKSGFMSADAQLICDDAFASSELWAPLTGELAPAVDPVARADYGIPETYTKVKIFVGTYGFGDAEIVAAFTDDETGFYLTFVCFDETQIVEGTINNGIAMVTYDLTGFMSADAQLICDDAFASEEPWAPLQ